MNPSNELGRPAEVVAHRCRVRYHRHGSGRPVILLRPPELLASVDAALLGGLAARFRVLVPVPVTAEPTEPSGGAGDGFPSDSEELTDETLRRLTCFVEGLGIMDGGLVAAGRYGSAAVALAATMSEQVVRVVLLDASGPDEHGSPSRILRVEGDPGRAGSALPRIVSFLLREDDPRLA